jgi:hypothetical protein
MFDAELTVVKIYYPDVPQAEALVEAEAVCFHDVGNIDLCAAVCIA